LREGWVAADDAAEAASGETVLAGLWGEGWAESEKALAWKAVDDAVVAEAAVLDGDWAAAALVLKLAADVLGAEGWEAERVGLWVGGWAPVQVLAWRRVDDDAGAEAVATGGG